MFFNPHYTYMWQKQPYISWKGKTTDSAVPVYSRPLVNGRIAPHVLYDECLTPEEVIDMPNGPSFKARPIKHWRKQLDPRKGSGRGRAGVGMPMDTPGGKVHLGNQGIREVSIMGRNDKCDLIEIKNVECECKNAKRLKDNIMNFGDCGERKFVNPNPLYGSNNLKFLNRGSCPIVVDCDYQGVEDCKQPYDHDDPHVVCVACNPEAHVLKPASTIVKKKYYTDSRAYLKSRCRTYDQNLSGIRARGVKYFGPHGEYLYPSDSPNGSQVRYGPNCNMKCCQTTPGVCNCICNVCKSLDYCHCKLIYKPSNAQYGVQGAVSSSSRIDRLKYNTITKNGASFRSAFGSEGANAGKYHGTSTAPYFLKSKNQVCVNYHRQGNHTVCFLTPTGSIGNKHPVIPPAPVYEGVQEDCL